MLIRQSLPLLIAALVLNLSACNEKVEQVAEKKMLDASLCDFSRGECIKKVAGVELKFTLSPSHAPSEKPLTLKLLSSSAISDVQIRLEGRDMFMGVIPVNIRELNKNAYEGQMIYGSCSSGYMVWRGFVSFTFNGESKTVTFDFLADNNA